MRLNKKLEKVFLLFIFLPLLYILFNWYTDKQFKDNPLSPKTLKRVELRQNEVLSLIQKNFNTKVDIPLIISDEFDSRLYGLTGHKEGRVEIYLNKKRFKESEDYMIDEVIPHEYAHAMIFILGEKTSKDGHTALWQKICLQLDGKRCERYVDNEDIVRQKLGY